MTIVGGVETLVNTHTPSHQQDPRLTPLPDGGWIVTWASLGQNGAGYCVYRQIYNADGSLRGVETGTSSPTASEEIKYDTVALATGGSVLTWTRDDGTNFGIYQQVYDEDGAPVGGELRINTYTTTLQWDPHIAALTDGGWVVTWQSHTQDGAGYGIYQQAFNADGTARGGETRVNSYVTSHQIGPEIAALGNGGWVATWQSLDQDTSNYGIYQQRYDAAGAPIGGETRVNTHAHMEQDTQAIVALGDGGWVVVWQSYTQDGSEYGVYQQAYNANGSPRGGETRVNTETIEAQKNPQVTALTGGGWVVTWQSYDPDGSDFDICQQAYNAAGAPQGSETRVNSHTDHAQSEPQITALSDGGWVVTWQSSNQDGSFSGIYQQAYRADGSSHGAETRVNVFATDEQASPQVAALEDGGWVVSWNSLAQDGSGWGVYQRVFRALNEAPAISSNGGAASASLQLSENALQVATLAGTDPNADDLTWSLSGEDAALFVIDGLTGKLSFRSAPDFEAPADVGADNTYEIVVRLSDAELSDTQALSIQVTDIAGVTILGNSGHDFIGRGQTSSGQPLPTGESDSFTGAGGNDTILAGSGAADQARFTGHLADYVLSRTLDGTVRVTDKTTGRDGMDTLLGVEKLVFADAGVTAAGVPTATGFVLGATQQSIVQYGSNAGGWTSHNTNPRHLADVNGDQFDDIVGFGNAGVLVSLGKGNGAFAPAQLMKSEFGKTTGWASNDTTPRHLADVNGDGRADIVGFGNSAVFVSLATGNGGFGATTIASSQFAKNTGWSTQTGFPRQLADVNGDGRADIVGFGGAGVFVSLGQSNGTFGTIKLARADFGVQQSWTSSSANPRLLGDVNGDGRADIVAFGNSSVFVSLGQADGTFAAGFVAGTQFAKNSGWVSNDANPRQLQDLNGDGRADIVGFGNAGVYATLATANGTFGPIALVRSEFGRHGGWTTQDGTPRLLADIDGDGGGDIVAFGPGGVKVALSNETGFLPDVWGWDSSGEWADGFESAEASLSASPADVAADETPLTGATAILAGEFLV